MEGDKLEEIQEGEEEEAQVEVKGTEGVTEGGEAEFNDERLDGAGENQQTGGLAEAEPEGKRGEGCANVEVSSLGEDAACEAEGMKEREEEQKNEEMQLPTEDPQQTERLVE